jgi:replicative DNA helicase
VARLSGVPLARIADRSLTREEVERVGVAVASLRQVADRLAFLRPPFAFEHVAAAATAVGANVLTLDYLQRFSLGTERDQRERIDAMVAALRRFCDAGAAVLCAAAVARQKSATGSTYSGLSLASFRGSSELEFGADSCYLLVPDRDRVGVTFQCEKNRHGPTEDIRTTFDRSVQAFAPAPPGLDRFDVAATAAPSRTRKRS